MPKSGLSITALISAVAASMVCVFATFIRLAGGDDPLPRGSQSVALAVAGVLWVGYFQAMARDRSNDMAARFDLLHRRLAEMHRRHDGTHARQDRLDRQLDGIKQYLGVMTDAVEAYGDDRETIGRLANFREQIEVYEQQVTGQVPGQPDKRWLRSV